MRSCVHEFSAWSREAAAGAEYEYDYEPRKSKDYRAREFAMWLSKTNKAFVFRRKGQQPGTWRLCARLMSSRAAKFAGRLSRDISAPANPLAYPDVTESL